ncbi:MAG: gephyrin-like molybdotransferase Glp [Planctomycetales bacterium]
MLSVEDALALILKTATPLPQKTLQLIQSLGFVLADSVVGELSVPPFDKSLMDGYALRSSDFQAGMRTYRVTGEVTAGKVPTHTVGSGEAVRVMTGASIPTGADAVVIVEQTATGRFDDLPDDQLQITAQQVHPEQHILRKGAVARPGSPVVSAGTLLRPQEIAALAESGIPHVQVYSQPRVSILATGDEIVPLGQPLKPGQIWNSNEPMLAAQMAIAGAVPQPLGAAADDPAQLRERIQEGLKSDVLLLSGGVSAGKKDLVPAELERAGVRQVFHKIDMKPGKPLWFGISTQESRDGGPPAHRCLVFGLPGNPVSSMVCAELFVRPALLKLRGIQLSGPPRHSARLVQPYHMRGDRPTYHPARLFFQGSELCVELVDWIGSSDLRATVHANGLIFLPAGDKQYAPGDLMTVVSWQQLPTAETSPKA